MLKSDLITILIERRGMTEAQAEAAVETILKSMADALCAGEGIEIRGFGAFHVKHYDGYQGRNPKTGEVIAVKAKRGVLFRTGRELRERMNASTAEPAETPSSWPPTTSEA
jgi:integration host factor subunit beta